MSQLIIDVYTQAGNVDPSVTTFMFLVDFRVNLHVPRRLLDQPSCSSSTSGSYGIMICAQSIFHLFLSVRLFACMFLFWIVC